MLLLAAAARAMIAISDGPRVRGPEPLALLLLGSAFFLTSWIMRRRSS